MAPSHSFCFYHGSKGEPTIFFRTGIFLSWAGDFRDFTLWNETLKTLDRPGYTEPVSVLPCMYAVTLLLGLDGCQEEHTLTVSFRHRQTDSQKTKAETYKAVLPLYISSPLKIYFNLWLKRDVQQ